MPWTKQRALRRLHHHTQRPDHAGDRVGGRGEGPRTHLGVGSGASQLILPLLVVGLSLAPGLAALVPVVPRDAYMWEQGAEALATGVRAGTSRGPDPAPGGPHAQLSKVGFPTAHSGVCSITKVSSSTCGPDRALSRGSHVGGARSTKPLQPLQPPQQASAARTRAPPSSGMRRGQGSGRPNSRLGCEAGWHWIELIPLPRPQRRATLTHHSRRWLRKRKRKASRSGL